MIFGAHLVLYSKDAAADRAFLRDTPGLRSVDAGHDWLIFALPPSEAAIHPSGSNERPEIASLTSKGVHCSAIHEERWGSITKIQLPGGSEVGLYQPKHPLALTLA